MIRYAEASIAQMEKMLATSAQSGLDAEEAKARLQGEETKRPKAKSKYTVKSFFKTALRRLSPLLIALAVLLAFLAGEGAVAMAAAFLYLAFILFMLVLWLYSAGVSSQVEAQMRPSVWVIRQGKRMQVPQEELVYGDLLWLEEGSVLPFTAFLVSSEEITVWTERGGKYLAVKKKSGVFFESENPPNILCQGDVVRQGKAMALLVAPHKEAFQVKTDAEMPTHLFSIGRMVSRICYVLSFLMMALSFLLFKDSLDLLRILLSVGALMALSPLEWLDFLSEAVFYMKNAKLLRTQGSYIKSLRRAHRLAHADCFVLPASFFVSGEMTYVSSFLNGAGVAVSPKKGSPELSFVSSCLCSMEQKNGSRQKKLSDFFACCARKHLPELLGFGEVVDGKSYASIASFRWEEETNKPFSLVGADASLLLSHLLYAKENERTHLLDAQTKERLRSALSLYKANGYRVVAYARTAFVPKHKGEKIGFDALCDMKLLGFFVLGSSPNREANEFLRRMVKEGKKAVLLYRGEDPSDLLRAFSSKFSFEVLEGKDAGFENKVASFAADKKRHFLLLCGASPVQKAGTVRALEAVGYSTLAYGESFEEHRMLCAAKSAVSAPFSGKNEASSVVYDTAEVHSEKRIRALCQTQSVAKDMVGAVSTLTVYLTLSLLLRTVVALVGVLFSTFLLSVVFLLAAGVALDLFVVFSLAGMRFPQGTNGEEKKNLSHVFAWIAASLPTGLTVGGIALSLSADAFPFSSSLFVSVSLILLLNVTLLSFSRVKPSLATACFPLYSLCLVFILTLSGLGGLAFSFSAAFSLACWVLLPLAVFIASEKLLQIFFKNHIKLKEIYYE